MKVALINPIGDNEIRVNLPAFVKENRGFNPPLGLLYVAAYLLKYTQHRVTVVDCQAEGLNYDSLAARIVAIAPDIAGITTVTMALIDVLKTAALVKKINRDTRVVLGGPHVHLFPQQTINLANIDYLVMGEGEEAFRQLLDFIDDKSRLRGIPGLAFKDQGQVINTGLAGAIENLDSLPYPARKLTLYRKYTSLLTERDPTTTVITSRGCPFNCSFCERSHLGKRFRARSAENVVDELAECAKIGILDFLFYDDTFTIDKQRVIDICRQIIKNKLKIRWDIRSRVDTVDEELLSYLKKAGCCGIHYGVESGTEKILKALNKEISISQIRQAFKLTRKYRIPTLAYFIIGNPSETLQDIRQSFRLMRELNPDYAHISILAPFPGTSIYRQGLESGVIKKDYWAEFAKNPTADFKFPYWGEIFTRKQLLDLLNEGYKTFYMRPGYVLKSIFALKSLKQFKKKAAAGIELLLSTEK